MLKHIRPLILIGADSLLSCWKKTKGSRVLSKKTTEACDCGFPETCYLVKSNKAAFKIYLRSGEGAVRCGMMPESKTHRLFFCSFTENGDFLERDAFFFF